MKFLRTVFILFQAFFNYFWPTTNVKVPVGADINNYTSEVKAELKDDYGNLVDQSKLKYTFISEGALLPKEINTNVVGYYKVKYKVMYENITESIATKDIYFEVYDHLSPTFEVLDKDFKVRVNEKFDEKEFILKHFLPNDNYAKIRKIIETKNEKDLSYHFKLDEYLSEFDKSNIYKTGEYDCVYILKDGRNYAPKYKFKIKVVDDLAPVIKQKKGINILEKTTFKWQDYFQISDNYDSHIPDSYVETRIEGRIDIPGTAKFYIKVHDEAGNLVEECFQITVGERPPKIFLVDQSNFRIYVHEAHLKNRLKQMVSHIEYYNNDYNKDNMIIDHNIKTDQIGTYNVSFYFKDLNGAITKDQDGKNEYKVNIKVQVVDLIKPCIKGKKDSEPPRFIKVKLGHLFNVLDHFKFEDNYNKPEDLTYKLSEKNIQTNKVNRYNITLILFDKSNNSSEFSFELLIVDDIPPLLEVPNIITIELNEKFDIKKHIKYSDNYDKKESLVVSNYAEGLNQEIELNKIGEFNGFVSITDSSGNTAFKEYKLRIVDRKAPIIILKFETLNYYKRGQIPNFRENILEVNDNYDEIDLAKVQIIHSIDFEKIGCYDVFYQISDSSKNIGYARLIVNIDDKNFPSLELNPIIFDEKDLINETDLLKGIDTEELKKDGYKLSLLTEMPKQLSAGKYLIKYQLTNKRGYSKEFEREIKIVQRVKKTNFIIAISVLSGIVISGIFVSLLTFKLVDNKKIKLAKKEKEQNNIDDFIVNTK